VSDEKDGAGESAKPPKPAKESKPPKEKGAGKKGFPWVFLLVPVALVAALVLAFTLPPTHALLMKTPLAPLLARLSPANSKGPAGKPQTSADPAAADPVAEVKRLNAQIETDKDAAKQKDAQIGQLQGQVTKLQAPPSTAPTPAGKPTPPIVSDEVKRTAAVWAGMDADKAADIINALPDAYVKSVLSQMPPDAVADIMSALPAKTAARLTDRGGD
jgi:hypothetical protein